MQLISVSKLSLVRTSSIQSLKAKKCKNPAQITKIFELKITKQGNEAPVLLGETTGADDGFCPFEEGVYEITQDESSICVSWCFDPSNKDRSCWRSQSFDLSK